MVKIAIIGGSGLDDPAFLSNREDLPAPYETPYGASSNQMISGVLNGVNVVLISRHGKRHSSPPSAVNYRANIYTIDKILNCDAILATNACGSLRADFHKVGDLAVVDQFLDFTGRGGCFIIKLIATFPGEPSRTTRNMSLKACLKTKGIAECLNRTPEGQRGPPTFYDGIEGHLKGVVHAPMAHPFCQPLRKALLDAAHAASVTAHDGATAVVVEGPRFSSRAENEMFRILGGHIIGMTMVPEVCLANELGIPYASLAIITDLDVEPTTHHEEHHEESVSHDLVLKTMKMFSERMTKTLAGAVSSIATLDLESMKKAPSAH